MNQPNEGGVHVVVRRLVAVPGRQARVDAGRFVGYALRAGELEPVGAANSQLQDHEALGLEVGFPNERLLVVAKELENGVVEVVLLGEE